MSVTAGFSHTSKRNDILLQRLFWWSSYFKRLIPPNIPRFNLARFLSLKLLKRNGIQQHPKHIGADIQSQISRITFQMLRTVSASSLKIVRADILERGGPFQHLL
jgi:hypothetical protein